jgi:hypothetical protein
MRVCEVPGCGKKHYSTGLCNMHKTRVRKYGRLEGRPSWLPVVKNYFSYPIGTERIQHYANLGPEWYIKVANRTWKRKADVVMEEAIGRDLFKSEIVHFKDGNILNPLLSNLELCLRFDVRRAATENVKTTRKNTKLTREDVRVVRALSSYGFSLSFVSRLFCVSRASINSIRRGHTWKEVETMSKSTRWKALVEQIAKMQNAACEALFDRLQLLMKLEQEPAFHEAMGKEGIPPMERLNDLIADVSMNYIEAKGMLAMFPSRNDWKGTNSYMLRARYHENNAKARAEAKKARQAKSGKSKAADDDSEIETGKRVRHSVTTREYEDLQTKCDRLQLENDHLRREIDTLKTALKAVGVKAPRRAKARA